MSMKIKGKVRFVAALIVLLGMMGENILAQESIIKGEQIESSVDEILQSMTLEEKIAQMFFVTPEALTGIDGVIASGPATEQAFQAYPVGGIVYFEQNIQDREQVTSMLSNMQSISEKNTGIPIFLATDEEGGMVTRVYGSGVDNIPYVSDMLSIGSTDVPEQAYWAGNQIGSYLNELGFNVNFAPVADIYSNMANTVIGSRAFGYDAETVSEMVPMAVRGLKDAGLKATLKHFPGHGDTAEDSHAGYASSYKTMDELRNCELLPFQAGIEAGADFVMIGHISVPNVTGDDTPASLSYTVVTKILREEMGFDGIVITDALNMGAISNNYTSGQAAVEAVRAGVDMLLMPYDFHSAYTELLNAVYDGRIAEEQINESVRRIVRVKEGM